MVGGRVSAIVLSLASMARSAQGRATMSAATSIPAPSSSRAGARTPPAPHGSFHRQKGRWGWVKHSRSQSIRQQSKKLSLQVLYPPGGDASFHLEKDDGVGLTSIDMMPK